MNPINKLVIFLNDIIQREGKESTETLAGYIVGELIGDYDGLYEGLEDTYPDVARIADLASDIERSNGSEEQLNVMWQELKQLVKGLEDKYSSPMSNYSSNDFKHI